MISVGITGGIGSGKTTICKLFERLDVPVYYADLRAKILMHEDAALKEKIIALFGDSAYSEGQLNRTFIAETVFDDNDKLTALNNLVHPAVFQDTTKWMQAHENHAYVLYEAAIMFESGSYKMLNKVITVYADESSRIKRVKQRDQSSEEEIRKRMAKQMPEEEKMKLADYTIYNDGKQSLISQILEIHKELIKLSAS